MAIILCPIIVHFSTWRAHSMHDMACEFARAAVRGKDAQKQLARTSLKINLYQYGKSHGNILFLGIEKASFSLCSKQVGDPLYQLNIFPLLLFFQLWHVCVDVINQRCGMIGYTCGFCDQWHVAQVKKHVKIIRSFVISVAI